jgi:hypothetical protein
VPPDDDPASTLSRVFGAAFGDDAVLAKQKARRKSVIDLVSAELGDLRGRVGKDERSRLDEHLESVRKLELSVATGASCSAPAGVTGNPQDNDSFPDVLKAQTDILTMALACGMTRVASLQCSHTVSPTVFSWLGLSEGHHSLSHADDSNTQGVNDFVTAERWYATQFGYLLDRLRALPDPDGGGGTLLDGTVVVWAKELGDGRLHECKGVPFVLAGGGGAIRTAQHLVVDGEPHQKLLVAICQAVGLSNPTFGDPSHGTGPLGGVL